MTNKRRSYTREFKIEAVRLVKTSGKTQADIADELGIPPSCLSSWKKEYAGAGESAFSGREHLAATGKRSHTVEAYGRDARLFGEWFRATNDKPLPPSTSPSSTCGSTAPTC